MKITEVFFYYYYTGHDKKPCNIIISVINYYYRILKRITRFDTVVPTDAFRDALDTDVARSGRADVQQVGRPLRKVLWA